MGAPSDIRRIEFASLSADAAIARKGGFESMCRAEGLEFHLLKATVDYERSDMVMVCTYAFAPGQDLSRISTFFGLTAGSAAGQPAMPQRQPEAAVH